VGGVDAIGLSSEKKRCLIDETDREQAHVSRLLAPITERRINPELGESQTLKTEIWMDIDHGVDIVNESVCMLSTPVCVCDACPDSELQELPRSDNYRCQCLTS
jgi:hypothetical protein